MYDPARDSWQKPARSEDVSRKARSLHSGPTAVAPVAVAAPVPAPSNPIVASAALAPTLVVKQPLPKPAAAAVAAANGSGTSRTPSVATPTRHSATAGAGSAGSATSAADSSAAASVVAAASPAAASPAESGLPARPSVATPSDTTQSPDPSSQQTPDRLPRSDARGSQHKYHQYRQHRQNYQPYKSSAKDRTSRHGSSHNGLVLEDEEVKKVQEHYNSLPSYRAKDRKKSGIFGVRTFNNMIKSILIDRYTQPRSVALDMGCGRGGDLFKWFKAGVDGLIGIDIADVSINHAKQRYNDLKQKVFWVDFCVGDAYAQSIEDIVHPKAFPVDIVSIQFALHYAFSSEVTARMALENVSKALKKGGTFIGTIPSSEYLAKHLRNGQTEWGNSIFQIKFDEPNPKGEFRPIFGHRYSFFLKEAVEEVPEYVIPIDGFKALAQEYGLRLELYQPFMEFFNSSIRDNDIFNVAESQNIINRDGSFKIDPEQLAASEVYAVFAFVKE